MSLPRNRQLLVVATLASAALVLTACSSAAPEATKPAEAKTITVEATNGSITVPVAPKRVVALDNTSFETLYDWGITPVALPKDLLPARGFEKWVDDESIVNLGTHREPDLEALSGLDADLVIGGYRFGEYTEQIEAMGIAPVIDIAPSADSKNGWVADLTAQTETLGEIFAKEKEADATIKEFTAAEAAAAQATSGETIFLSVVSGGKIDNGAERIGTIIEPLNLQDVFAGKEGDIHGDSGLAPETIAQANPDWVLVLDRDAAAGPKDASPAQEIFDRQEAFSDTTFAQKQQIIYLNPFFYTREGIQAYGEAYTQIAEAFTAASK